ncbi:hypothetical protein GMSM_39780 [Geomonas sp. Red276]
MKGHKGDKFEFRIKHIDYQVWVQHLSLYEQISKPFSLIIKVVSKNEIDSHLVLGNDAVLTIYGPNGKRILHGIINNLMLSGKCGHFLIYEATVVPSILLLDLNKHYRAFQKMTPIEIVSHLLNNNDVINMDHCFRLESEYTPLRFCNQFGESDFGFISRVLEENGMFYYFEHTESGHTMIISDSDAVYALSIQVANAPARAVAKTSAGVR